MFSLRNFIEQVEFANELGNGPGVNLEFLTLALDNAAKQNGSTVIDGLGLFLPPLNDYVGNNATLIATLHSCGRVAKMALLHHIPQYGAWVTKVLHSTGIQSNF